MLLFVDFGLYQALDLSRLSYKWFGAFVLVANDSTHVYLGNQSSLLSCRSNALPWGGCDSDEPSGAFNNQITKIHGDDVVSHVVIVASILDIISSHLSVLLRSASKEIRKFCFVCFGDGFRLYARRSGWSETTSGAVRWREPRRFTFILTFRSPPSWLIDTLMASIASSSVFTPAT